MELWLLFGLLSPLSYAISSSIDKHFMTKKYDPVTTNTFKMFFDGTFLLLLGVFLVPLTFTKDLILGASLIGIIYAAAGILYFKSLQEKDLQVAMPFFQSTSIAMLFILSLYFFNESASPFNVVGVLLIIGGVFLVLAQKHSFLPSWDKGMKLMIIVVFLGIIASLLTKKLLFDFEPLPLAIAMYFSSTFFLLLYSFFHHKKKKIEVQSAKIAVSAIFGALGTYFLFSALVLGDASKVYSISGAQSVFIFLLSIFFLKERFVLLRFGGVLAVFVGIYFLSF